VNAVNLTTLLSSYSLTKTVTSGVQCRSNPEPLRRRVAQDR